MSASRLAESTDQREIMSTQPTAGLVNGAFADASGFTGVIRPLHARGVPVRAPMKPLRGLAFLEAH